MNLHMYIMNGLRMNKFQLIKSLKMDPVFMMCRYLLIILSLILTGCKYSDEKAMVARTISWNYDDLILLDPADAKKPEQDIIALYTRIIGDSFQIRIDFVDLFSLNRADIYIPIDTNEGGSNSIFTVAGTIPFDIDWDYLIIMPAEGLVKVVDRNYLLVSGLELLISMDNSNDNLTISFNRNKLPINWNLSRIQVLCALKNKITVVEKTKPVFIDNPPPPKARVMFLFWNVFNAKTPSQTLRAWAGAHSGPLRDRHGLSYLIDAARNTNTPIFLMGLLNQDSISALDYIDSLSQIRELEKKGIIGLIDENLFFNVIYADETYPDDEAPRLINKIFDIYPNINFDWIAKTLNLSVLKDNFVNNNSLEYFIGYSDYAKLMNFTEFCPLHLSEIDYPLDNLKNFLRCKSILINSTITPAPSLIIVGGDFSASLLGNPAFNTLFFQFIQNLPWIEVLSATDIVSSISDYSARNISIENIDYEQSFAYSSLSSLQNKIYFDLLRSPANQMSYEATRIFTDMSRPGIKGNKSLESLYISQIGHLLKASKWADHPVSINDCTVDIDYDNAKECILANSQIFMSIEPQGGYIPFIFFKNLSGMHQLIGPTWEFILGISDPSEWDLSQGLLADPGQILGALEDDGRYLNMYDANNSENRIELSTADKTITKFISIENNKVIFNIINNRASPSSSRIPIVLDPWIRYQPNWGDQYYLSVRSKDIIWGIKDGISLEISTFTPFEFFSFNSSKAEMLLPENPNFDYPPGHYLPYPINLLEIQSGKEYTIELLINP